MILVKVDEDKEVRRWRSEEYCRGKKIMGLWLEI